MDAPARPPDLDLDLLRAWADREMPGVASVTRTPSGGSTPVYDVVRRGRKYYLRVAESAGASLAPERLVHAALRECGVRVPAVVAYEERVPGIGRSLMLTTEIPGDPVAESPSDMRAVMRAAGRDLAAINRIDVDGHGWVRRDDPAAGRLRGELGTATEAFLVSLPDDLNAVRPLLDARLAGALASVVTAAPPVAGPGTARLAHGDFDTTHIYTDRNGYAGIIDFGEIRGAPRLYDLGHFALHDRERHPAALLDDLVAGYDEVAPLDPADRAAIPLWAVVIGLRVFARTRERPLPAFHAHLRRALDDNVRRLGQLG